jgi:hypothetical protein
MWLLENSNVALMYNLLEKAHPDKQIVYYQVLESCLRLAFILTIRGFKPRVSTYEVPFVSNSLFLRIAEVVDFCTAW